jgi:hypothetical protein
MKICSLKQKYYYVMNYKLPCNKLKIVADIMTLLYYELVITDHTYKKMYASLIIYAFDISACSRN